VPELPEVETVARGLRAKILNKRIASLEYRRANLRFALPRGLLKTMPGKKIVAIDRHSKYILFRLESGESVLLHLGMSGRLLFGDKNYKAAKHDHVIVNFAGGMKLVFNDARRFGVFDAVPKDALHRLQKNIGPDALSSEWTPETLHAAIVARKTDMKAILMNQKIIAGLGNIYVSEALYRAKISPTRSGKKVTLKEAAKLLAASAPCFGRRLQPADRLCATMSRRTGSWGTFRPDSASMAVRGPRAGSVRRPYGA